MATLIQNEETLRHYMPNVFAVVKGETPLFDKVAPFLNSAEQWLVSNFCSLKTFNVVCGYTDDNPTKVTAQRIAVCEALRNAVPSLDLVLTPNGFGVVSNQNIAPASKERVARLVASLAEQRDDLLELFIPLLVGASKWKESEQFAFFSASLFPNIDLASICGNTANRWEKYVELCPKAIDIEDSFAEEFFSPELMNKLRLAVIGGSVTSTVEPVVRGIKAQVVDMLLGKPINMRRMVDLVNIIRNDKSSFPEWHNSATAKLFAPPVFKNSKKSAGYFF